MEKSEKIMIVIKDKNGIPSIDGMYCSYQTKKIRSIICSFFEVNKEFVLPKKYTYVVTEPNRFAKIIKAPEKFVCPLCNGSGRRVFPNCTPPVDEPCPACKERN